MSEGAAKKGLGEKPQPKEERRKFQAIRGTRDLLPPETALWNRVERIAQEVFASYGFGEVRLPIFEQTDLFARAVGGETDIVSKEMYTFEEDARKGFFLDQDTMDFVNAQNSPARMEKFLLDLNRRFDSGEIEQTAENKKAISSIRAISKELFAIPEPSEEGPEDVAMERFSSYLKLRKPFDDKLRDAWLQLQKKSPISLRPEATASVCRAYIEHNLNQLPQPVKLYYIGPMFRRERPQKGRYRQFYQIGAEVLEAVRPETAKDGSKELAKDAAIDAEVIEMLMIFFDRVGLQGTELSVNSIGHAADNCRRGYVAKLREELTKVKDLLGTDSQRRIETNPLRVLDSKLEHEQIIIAKLPHIADHLCDNCKTHYAELRRHLSLRGVRFRENWRLVRGLDYYMRTTFEITARGLGSQDAVCGGGRYDGLIELLGGPPAKGIGFAIGEDRVVLSLVHDKPLAQRRDIDLVLAWLSPETYTKAVGLARNLRSEGVKVDLPTKLMRAGDAVRYADRIGAYFTLLLGEDELKSGQFTLKHMLRQEQMKITEAELHNHLKHQNELRNGRTKKQGE